MATKRTVSLVIEYKNGKLVTRELKKTNDAAAKIPKNVERTERALNKAKIAAVAYGAMALYALKEVSQYMRHNIDLANQNEAAWIGLKSVARSFGADMGRLRKDFDELRESGMLADSAIISSQKNLVAMGFSANQSGRLLKGFADVAAFNRQGQLDLNQALEGGTSGLRNNMSQMIDNMGIQKNFSIILKDAGISQKDWNEGVDRSKNLQKLYIQLLKESAFAQGDLKRLADSNAGAYADYDQAMLDFNRTLGELANEILPTIITGFASAARAATNFIQAAKSGESKPTLLESILTGGLSPMAYGAGIMYANYTARNAPKSNYGATGWGVKPYNVDPNAPFSIVGHNQMHTPTPPPAGGDGATLPTSFMGVGGGMMGLRGFSKRDKPLSGGELLEQMPTWALLPDNIDQMAIEPLDQLQYKMAEVQSMAGIMGGAICGAFAAMASGAMSVGDALLSSVLGALGTIASMWGSFLISYGIGMSFVPGGQVAWGAVAKGAVLLALGGALQGMAGSVGGGGGGGGYSGGGVSVSTGFNAGGGMRMGGGQTIIVVAADGRASSGGSDIGRVLGSAGVTRNQFQAIEEIKRTSNV